MEGWKVGDPYVQSLSIECRVTDILSQCTLCCARKSVHTHRGNYQADRKDIYPHESHITCHPETHSRRHRLVAQDGLLVHQPCPLLPLTHVLRSFLLIRTSTARSRLHGYRAWDRRESTRQGNRRVHRAKSSTHQNRVEKRG